MDGVRTFLTGIMRRGFPLSLGPYCCIAEFQSVDLFLRPLYGWPRCKHNSDYVWHTRTSRVPSRTPASQWCMVLWLLRSMLSTKYPRSVCSLYMQPYCKASSYKFSKTLLAVSKLCLKFRMSSSVLEIIASVAYSSNRWLTTSTYDVIVRSWPTVFLHDRINYTLIAARPGSDIISEKRKYTSPS